MVVAASEVPHIQELHMVQATGAHLDHMQLLDMGDLRCSNHHTGLHPKTWRHKVTRQHLHSRHPDVLLDCNTSPRSTSCWSSRRLKSWRLSLVLRPRTSTKF